MEIFEKLKTRTTVNLSKTFVQSGEIYISKKAELIWTVLGSCITVIFYIKSKGITLFSHAQLPSKNLMNDSCISSCSKPCYMIAEKENKFKYVTCSINYMVEEVNKLNITKKDIKIYLLGGASSFNITMGNSKNVAERNVEVAQKMLKRLNIPIVEDTSGRISRKVSFNTLTGELAVNI